MFDGEVDWFFVEYCFVCVCGGDDEICVCVGV